VDERRQQFPQHVGVGSGESISQHSRPVDIVGSGHRVYSFARVTLDGLSKNHAMTFIYPATTRRTSPARTPRLLDATHCSTHGPSVTMGEFYQHDHYTDPYKGRCRASEPVDALD
jgi:hypothetical protein